MRGGPLIEWSYNIGFTVVLIFHFFYSSPLQVDEHEMYAMAGKLGRVRDIRQLSDYSDGCHKYLVTFKALTKPLTGQSFKWTVHGKQISCWRRELDCSEKYQLTAGQLQTKMERIQARLNVGLMVAPGPHSPANMLKALNEDCLEQIFNKMVAYDLMNVSKTCTIFRKCAKKTFKTKYGRRNHSLMYDLRHGRLERDYLSLCQVESCIRTFADEILAFDDEECIPNMHDIIFFGYKHNPGSAVILRMLNELCPNIESLAVPDIIHTPGVAADIRSMLPRLRRLSLKVSDVPEQQLNDWFVGDLPLKVLHYYGDSNSIRIELPHLVELNVELNQNENYLEPLLSRNSQIRKFKLVTSSIHLSDLDLIPTYLPNCTELTLVGPIHDHEYGPLSEWHKFTSLNSLHLDCTMGDSWYPPAILESLTADEIPLKNLTLRVKRSPLKEVVEKDLTRLKHLKTITFITLEYLDVDWILDATVNLAANLDKLLEVTFKLEYNTTADIKKFLTLLQIEPPGFAIRFISSGLLTTADCEEITGLLGMIPTLKFKLETSASYLNVSHFCLIFWILPL